MADLEKHANRYPSDLIDEEWSFIRSFSAVCAKARSQTRDDLRQVLNALSCLARTGGGTHPKDFPPWQMVYWWFRRLVRWVLFRTIQDVALMLDRERKGRKKSPTASRSRRRPRRSAGSMPRRRSSVVSATSRSTDGTLRIVTDHGQRLRTVGA